MRVVAACVLAAVLAGCSGGEGLRCEDPSPYAASTSIPPIRVPDDLTVPDESQSLLIPEVPSEIPEAPPAEACLEAPPRYFDEERSD